ncbi:MAG TPA: aldo/keto reductase [Chloroflexota bacterium]|jgi:aryl-alcohol dehydrogenase-like predicted oxidoreductase|nr:aldo/keto reductase [Chloroflexota bacterium]
MQTRKLGSQGPEVSAVGFGAWAAGGRGWGEVDDRDTVAAIRRSIDLEATFVDTAEVYGGGHSEEIVGDAIRGVPREGVFVATKVSGSDLSPQAIKRAIDGSLRRLAVDHVDLYQMHWPDPATDVHDSMRALDDLVRDGKIRYVGASNFDVKLMRACLEVRHLDSLQPPLDMLKRDIEAEILPFCLDRGIGVVVYSPMAKGLLTGKYTTTDTFPSGDVRAEDPRFQGEAFYRNLRIVERLRPIAERHGRTLPQLAISWTLAHPAVTVAIVGAKRPAQVDENIGGQGWALTPQDMEEIDFILTDTP